MGVPRPQRAAPVRECSRLLRDCSRLSRAAARRPTASQNALNWLARKARFFRPPDSRVQRAPEFSQRPLLERRFSRGRRARLMRPFTANRRNPRDESEPNITSRAPRLASRREWLTTRAKPALLHIELMPSPSFETRYQAAIWLTLVCLIVTAHSRNLIA